MLRGIRNLSIDKYQVLQLQCAFFLLIVSVPAAAETVQVKYRGEINLSTFQCETISRSSFIKRVCYDAANRYLVLNLKGTYYHYCGVPNGTIADFMAAPSMGSYFNKSIRETGNDGLYNCSKRIVPRY